MSDTPTASSSPLPGPAYRVRTPRLLLRCYEPSDIEPRLEAVVSSGEHLHGFFPPTPAGPLPLDFHLAQVRRFRGNFDLDQDRCYVALDAETGELLGEVCLLTRAGLGAREVGYWMRRSATGRGLATEMAAAATRIAFELDKVKRMDLMCSPENTASAGVARRLGYTLEGRLRDRQLAPHHQRGDLFCFTLLASEYPQSAAHAVPIEAFDMLGRRLFQG